MRIKELLKEKGITAKELAERLGVTNAALSQAINGNPTVEYVTRIASALGVSVSELFEPPARGVITCPRCGAEITLNPTVGE